jgi:hypothetical protein
MFQSGRSIGIVYVLSDDWIEVFFVELGFLVSPALLGGISDVNGNFNAPISVRGFTALPMMPPILPPMRDRSSARMNNWPSRACSGASEYSATKKRRQPILRLRPFSATCTLA